MQKNTETFVKNNLKLSSVGAREGVAQIGDLLIQWGCLSNVETPESSYNTVSVNFKKRFKNAPSAIVSPSGNYNIKADVSSVNTSTLNVNVRSLDGVAHTDRNIYWIAIGDGS